MTEGQVQQVVAERIAEEVCPMCNCRPKSFVAVFWGEGGITAMSFECKEHGIYFWCNDQNTRERIDNDRWKLMQIYSALRVHHGLEVPIT